MDRTLSPGPCLSLVYTAQVPIAGILQTVVVKALARNDTKITSDECLLYKPWKKAIVSFLFFLWPTHLWKKSYLKFQHWVNYAIQTVHQSCTFLLPHCLSLLIDPQQDRGVCVRACVCTRAFVCVFLLSWLCFTCARVQWNIYCILYCTLCDARRTSMSNFCYFSFADGDRGFEWIFFRYKRHQRTARCSWPFLLTPHISRWWRAAFHLHRTHIYLIGGEMSATFWCWVNQNEIFALYSLDMVLVCIYLVHSWHKYLITPGLHVLISIHTATITILTSLTSLPKGHCIMSERVHKWLADL